MIDLHSHVLPKVFGDDGAADLNEAVEMGRLLADAGIVDVFATPHCIEGEALQDYVSLQAQTEALNRAYQEAGIPLTVHLGCEILYHNEILNRLETGRATTLGKSNYVLIELPMRTFPEEAPHLISELSAAGYRPVIAHPERNRVLSAHPEKLAELLTRGAFAQLNLCSVTGLYGETAKQTAREFLESGMYHLVGSDIHNPNLGLTEALQELKNIVSEDYFENLTRLNGQRVIENKAVERTGGVEVPQGVIKPEKIKNRTQKKRAIWKTVAVSAAVVLVAASGLVAYADYKIQQELQSTLASAGITSDAEIEKIFAASNTGSETENAGETADVTAAENTNSTAESQSQNGSSETAQTKTETTSGSSENKAAAASNSSLKKLTLSDKAKAYQLVVSKINPSTINHLKGLAAGGFTAEEKKEAKAIFYSSFSAEEQAFLLNLYRKGK